MLAEPSEVTRLLNRWSAGDPTARDELIPLLYERLRRLARHRRRTVPGEHSLNTTALVHEAYLRLAGERRVNVSDRAHFLALTSRVMRNLLVDHARARAAAKRGGGKEAIDLDDSLWMSDDDCHAIVELDAALGRLAGLNPRQNRILECHYFGGLSLAETAVALGVSVATVKRELRLARAWLALELGGDPIP
jgi:RNA polymerase sigma factor (TIGR02999 family)